VERETQYLSWEAGESYSSVKDDFGLYVFKNGDRYIGEWRERRMEGMGIYLFHSPDPLLRTVYLGEFLRGKFHGFGKLARFNDAHGQMIYCGAWIEGRKAHIGLHYYHHPHTFYFGGWSNDAKHGEGKLVFPNGEFTGSWEADCRTGLGRLRKTENGLTQVYEGNWHHDQLLSGKVAYYDLKNNELGRYEGQLQDGKKHGKGVYSWRSAQYEGDFQHDTIRGAGAFKIGKTSLRGEFGSDHDLLSTPELKALIQYENGDQFEGVVSIRDAAVARLRGLYSFSCGDSAEGEFFDNPYGELRGRYLYRWSNGETKQVG
jgi:hypothetical protein